VPRPHHPASRAYGPRRPDRRSAHRLAATELFDAHFHVIDPRFPLVASQGYVPARFTVADYRTRTAGLEGAGTGTATVADHRVRTARLHDVDAAPAAGPDRSGRSPRLAITGGAVVAGSFQGLDQRWLLDALARLGPGFAGVAQLAPDVADAEVLALHAAGVRAVRFNLHRGGSLDARLARRVHALAGWHAEVYADGAALAALEPALAALPRLSVDHLGLTADALPVLLRLVAGGARVKATGFGRLSLDVAATLRAIAAEDPAALMWGTDLPGTRAPRPFAPADLQLVRAAGGDRALGENARAWYAP
jgi:predicted TIM-barrel fold metal-dependent hydrolase